MELLQLIYFCTAAETESFVQAAKKCGVPAASISHSVKRLENELQLPLFDRQANSVSLNERGKAFYLKVRSSLDMLSDAKKETGDERVAGKITLLAATHADLISKAVIRFTEAHPQVTFCIDHTPRETLNKYDFIITDNAPFQEDYKRERFLCEGLLAVVPRDHPLATVKGLTVKALQGEKLILFNEGSGMLSLVNRMCAQEAFSYHVKIQTDDVHCLVEYVESGIGIAIIPATLASAFTPHKVQIRAITNMTRASVICYSKDKYKTKATTLFLDTLRQTAKEHEQIAERFMQDAT